MIKRMCNEKCLETGSKPPNGLNLRVGPKVLILEILNIFLWLNLSPRLFIPRLSAGDLKPG